MVNSSQKNSRRHCGGAVAVGVAGAAHLHGIVKRKNKSSRGRSRIPNARSVGCGGDLNLPASRLPPPREITLRPVVVPSGLCGNVQKLHAEVARLEKLPVGSRYRKQRLQVVRHALKLATATETISASDELVLDKLLSSLSL